jgi:hypothetical protein
MERFDGKKKYYLNFKSEKRIEGNFQESKFKRLSLQNQILAANNTFFVNSTARHSMKPQKEVSIKRQVLTAFTKIGKIVFVLLRLP